MSRYEELRDASRVSMIREITAVVREADAGFMQSGGTSRHWVRDQFLPRLKDAGLVIVRVEDEGDPRGSDTGHDEPADELRAVDERGSQ